MTEAQRRWLLLALAVVVTTATLVLLGGTVLGTAAARPTVLAASAWFSAHVVLVYGWLAWRRPGDPTWRWYGLVALLWTGSLLGEIAALRWPEAPAVTTARMVLILGFMLSAFQLVFRVIGQPAPRAERLLLVSVGAILLLPALAFVAPALQAAAFHALLLLLRLGGLWVAWRLIRYLLRTADTDALILLWMGLSIMLVAFEELWTPFFPDAVFRHLVTPLIGLAMALLLVSHLIAVTARAEHLAAHLEGRVAERTRELENRHARVRELERDRAVQAERERLMRDMHDGAGGQLVGALALLSSKDPAVLPRLRERLEAALLELRLMIDSLDDVDGDVTAVLADFRSRMQPVLDAAGVRSRWQIDALPRLDGLGPRGVLGLLRILQEALTNAIRHARASAVSIRAVEDGGCICIAVSDDGCGFDTEAPVQGRGLANVRARAAALGADLQLRSGAGGTTLALRLPVAAPAS